MNENKESNNKTIINLQIYPTTSNKKMDEITLPEITEGKYYFEKYKELLSVVGIDQEWYFSISSDEYYFCNYDEKRIKIKNDDIFMLSNGNNQYWVIVNRLSIEDIVFYNYFHNNIKEIRIGKADDNDIVCSNSLVSRNHAKLVFEHEKWVLEDLNSTNGTYINGEKIKKKHLELGDIINLFGFKIIIGTGFISINNAGKVIINKNKIFKIIPNYSVKYYVDTKTFNKKLFNRSPREPLEFVANDIDVEGPPVSLNGNSIPLILRMGGSMVMGGASALSGNYIMLLSSVLFPMLSQKYTEKEKKEYENKRIVFYRKYLQEKNVEIQNEIQNEELILKKLYPELKVILNYPFLENKLWERRIIDDDFMNIRIGYGSIPMKAKIDCPKQKFTIDEDILENEMQELVQKEYYLSDVPIMIDFVSNIVTSVKGERYNVLTFIKKIIAYSVILHSYDELKLVILAEEADLESELFSVKYIPHIFNDQKNLRFVCTNTSEVIKIGNYIKNEIEIDLSKPRELKEILKKRPFYFILALNKNLFDDFELLKDVFQLEETCGVSVLTAFDDIPKESSLVINLRSKDENNINYLKEKKVKNLSFYADDIDVEFFNNSMKKISNIILKNIIQSLSLPKTVTFLEMFGVGKIDHLNILKRWHDSNPMNSLSTPIGIKTDGSLFCLDLHQFSQGPHGLVAGTTGSGKSEFLITYILSMAINYRPDEVSFVLIDYKGGGLADAFDDSSKGIHLPHLAGTITNLDGSSIQRSLICLESELIRRQKIFSEAKKNSEDEVTMDIYTYQRLYRNKKAKEPLPHLFIIADEFAELKAQQTEFMDKLISAARIGRSLGIHLILATQKPSGVVNDQIRSNTNFRVCLKVQDKSDSQDMLKRPEAAEIKETGRFYLQVGYNDYFALGQSAWCGADYEPRETAVRKVDNAVQLIDYTGDTILNIKPAEKNVEKQGTQLIGILKTLSEISKDQNIQTQKLWEPELDEIIDIFHLDENKDHTEEICCTLGFVDDPENQKQFVLNYHFENCHHLLIAGNAASGKTSLIQMILYSICNRYSSSEVNFYIMDFSSRMLKDFSNLPQCGCVLLDEEIELIVSFFEIIDNIISERKKLFSELNVDSFSLAKKYVSIPLVLVVIDNIAVLSSSKIGEKYWYNFKTYLKNSAQYGVKYIVTCNNANEINGLTRQEFGDKICLHLKDKYEYSDMLDCKVKYLPKDVPGRGMYKINEKPLETQFAMLQANLSKLDRKKWLNDSIKRLEEKYSGDPKAIGIPVLDDNITYDMFAKQFSKGRIPLGISLETHKAIAIPLRQLYMLSIYIGSDKGRLPIISNFLMAVENEGINIWFIKKNINSFVDEQNEEIVKLVSKIPRIISLDQKNIRDFKDDFKNEVEIRNNIRKQYCANNNIYVTEEKIKKGWKPVYDCTKPILLMFEDYFEFCNFLKNDPKSTTLDRCLQVAVGLNIYIFSFFYPEEKTAEKKGVLYKDCNLSDISMLFGGNYSKQSIFEYPDNIALSELSYNKVLMRYRGEYHVLLMPCGEISDDESDIDSQNIFT